MSYIYIYKAALDDMILQYIIIATRISFGRASASRCRAAAAGPRELEGAQLARRGDLLTARLRAGHAAASGGQTLPVLYRNSMTSYIYLMYIYVMS